MTLTESAQLLSIITSTIAVLVSLYGLHGLSGVGSTRWTERNLALIMIASAPFDRRTSTDNGKDARAAFRGSPAAALPIRERQLGAEPDEGGGEAAAHPGEHARA